MKAGILIAGPDATKFLQGQMTCDLTLLSAEQALYGAHCNQKGRVEALYDIFLVDQGILLVTEAQVVEHALATLEFYARFSKVKLSRVPICSQVEIQYADILARNISSNPPRPHLHLKTLGRFLPQELGLDQHLNAISLTKGCYLGQEIVARLHYLGKFKKQLVLIDLPLGLVANPGETIDHIAEDSVEIVDVESGKALVLKSI